MEYVHNRYKKLLVANRGEIAIRIFRAATELNIRTVAIYTFEDRYSLHRYKADEAYQIGPENEPLSPYLDIDEIIKVAKANDVDAIHPGYGFLSENVRFAERCKAEGIIFVGPTPEIMMALGDKVRAKEIAEAVNVPTIKDSQQDITSEEILLSEAENIGFPIMVKAAAGGGGRGMRIVRSASEIVAAYREAKREAKSAFGDDTIFLEKFIENPKHIEIQILGDQYGNIVHLYERDCSVQRRFQKVVEVAPSTGLSQSTLDQLYDNALKIARHVGYVNAGTVEFLVDVQQNVYFIEVNPRIQVEHTITEEITGIDLVRSQILVSMGFELSHETIFIRSQEDIKISGFAIQCRVTTEDPENNFKPDYGTLVAYRSASGFGIRLDAGSAYPGSTISPFFDSMLVKVTAWGRTLDGSADRLYRALLEFRIRGVKTNIGFLLNLLKDPTFRAGKATVNMIGDMPELMKVPRRRDRGTKMLRYLANVIVNGNEDVKYIDSTKTWMPAKVPAFDKNASFPDGTKQILTEKGPKGFADWLKNEKKIHFTDTTFRDAHQSLLATRMRTIDLLNVAESFSKNHGADVFSMEVWGGATFDVAMRFLKEDPWARLRLIREKVPNVVLQMLLRGSNGVGYKAYPDNLIVSFIEKAAETGIDLFRIFDSLNWIENMRTSIRTVVDNTDALAEACICYTGDILDPQKGKYNLEYYVNLARELEKEGAHILAIKDMAGLLKPYAAETLIKALKESTSMPIHLHTHDTSSVQSATYLKAIEAGVDAVDVALSAMSGLTSQPNFNSMVAVMQDHDRKNDIDLRSLNLYSDYWETVRSYYYPFETELRAGTASVYRHEIPGGQYSNLKPQARGLGLEDKFDTIRENYRIANEMFGNIVKVTPSSKVVGDMAMFMTSNQYTAQDILEKGDEISFPESVKALFRGDLGQPYQGFPAALQKAVLKDEKPYTERPNAHLEPIDLEQGFADFKEKFGPYVNYLDFLSWSLYPKVYEDYHSHYESYGLVRTLPSWPFFYGMKEGEEILVQLDEGKTLLIEYSNLSKPNEMGEVFVSFKLNGQARTVKVVDNSVNVEKVKHKKAERVTDVGSPLQGNLSKIFVKVGDKVEKNTPLFTIEAMKMESTITSPMAGVVENIVLEEKTMVHQDDLVLELEPIRG
ncbi:pyruvate carboxylase [Membranihabitans marinus]|uniref:pyruvate carboxylase n=1 Tax=Membranihabitans marinus TaxID=1227546 RepID=UPI001F030931|nr:pyruvate carboxylase [Membranihabitans marinus]